MRIASLWFLFGWLLVAAQGGEPWSASARMVGPETLRLTVSNRQAEEQMVKVEAGQVYAAGSARVVTLREASQTLGPQQRAEIDLPAAVLSMAALPEEGAPLSEAGRTDPLLEPLLRFLRTQNDLPRETSQCAVFALLENVDLHQWQEYSRRVAASGAAAEPAEQGREALSAALDAAALLHTLYPAREFRLYADPELRLRCLRSLALRRKAAAVFGLTLPGDSAPAAAVPPDLSQLLHTRPGDNCPICRQREAMQRSASPL